MQLSLKSDARMSYKQKYIYTIFKFTYVFTFTSALYIMYRLILGSY